MQLIIMYLGGIIFGLGLAVAGATKPEIVLSFLRLQDLGLMMVIGGALAVTLLVFQIAPRLLKKPPFGDRFDGHDGFPVTRRTVVGAILFGLGWGLSGLCPATALSGFGSGNWALVIGLLGMLLGALCYGLLRRN